MNAIETILTRRSVRSFTNEPIKEEHLNAVLDCAFSSPSACNKKPWEILIIKDKKTISDVRNIMGLAARPLETAPLLIIVLADLNSSLGDFWHVDCALFAENILLSARFFDIGTCYLGCYPKKDKMAELKKYFNLPSSIESHTLIALGYSKDPKNDFYKKTEIIKDKVHNEKY